MPYENQPMSDNECRKVAERIEHDAQLLADGAQIVPPGILRLSDVQLELAQRREDPLYVPFVGFEGADEHEQDAREQWLESDVFSLAGQDSAMLQRKSGSFKRFDLLTVRDFLVVGKELASRVWNVGATTTGRIEALINANAFGIEWKDEPTIDDIVALCPRLSQVNAHVLTRKTGSQVHWRSFAHRTSVKDVVEAGPDPSNGLIFTYGGSAYERAWKNLELYHDAKLFTVRYEDALPVPDESEYLLDESEYLPDDTEYL